MTKPTKWHVRPAKTQISLDIRQVWSESSLSAWRKLGSLATHWAHSEDPDQADLSLRWAHNHFVGFVMMRLNYCVSEQRRLWLADSPVPSLFAYVINTIFTWGSSIVCLMDFDSRNLERSFVIILFPSFLPNFLFFIANIVDFDQAPCSSRGLHSLAYFPFTARLRSAQNKGTMQGFHNQGQQSPMWIAGSSLDWPR